MSVLKLAPNFAQKNEVIYKLAVIFGKTYQLDQAIDYFKLAIIDAANPPMVSRKAEILVKIGICYLEKKEYENALKSFEAALTIEESSFRIFQHIAWCQFLMSKNDSSLENISKAINLKETDSDGYYILGRILLGQEKYSDAKEAFTKALLHNQTNAVYFISQGIAYCLTKMYSEAFECFLKATHLDQSISQVWFDIGILYENHHQISEASVAYQRAIDSSPDNIEALHRKQILETDEANKSPLPEYIHPEFRVLDSMIPNKSFIKNQKVKKAAEPSDASSIQSSNPMVIFFVSNNSRPIYLIVSALLLRILSNQLLCLILALPHLNEERNLNWLH